MLKNHRIVSRLADVNFGEITPITFYKKPFTEMC